MEGLFVVMLGLLVELEEFITKRRLHLNVQVIPDTSQTARLGDVGDFIKLATS